MWGKVGQIQPGQGWSRWGKIKSDKSMGQGGASSTWTRMWAKIILMGVKINPDKMADMSGQNYPKCLVLSGTF